MSTILLLRNWFGFSFCLCKYVNSSSKPRFQGKQLSVNPILVLLHKPEKKQSLPLLCIEGKLQIESEFHSGEEYFALGYFKVVLY